MSKESIMDNKLMSLEHELESKLNENQLMPKLREEVKEIASMPIYSGINNKILINALAYMLLYKRMEPGMMIGLLYPKFKNKDLIVNELEKIVKASLIQFIPERDELVSNFVLDEETQSQLDKFMYPLPLLVQPRELKTNMDTGYYYTPKESIVLRGNYTQDDVNLDHINRINSIAYRINTDVLLNQENKWNNCSFTTEQQKKNFKKFNKIQKAVAQLFASLGNKLYLTSAYDKRGRVYYRGYYLSPQGNDYAKALLEFNKGEKIY